VYKPSVLSFLAGTRSAPAPPPQERFTLSQSAARTACLPACLTGFIIVAELARRRASSWTTAGIGKQSSRIVHSSLIEGNGGGTRGVVLKKIGLLSTKEAQACVLIYINAAYGYRLRSLFVAGLEVAYGSDLWRRK